MPHEKSDRAEESEGLNRFREATRQLFGIDRKRFLVELERDEAERAKARARKRTPP